jgi:cytochrome c
MLDSLPHDLHHIEQHPTVGYGEHQMQRATLAGLAAALTLFAAQTAFADGDAAKGKAQFGICKICHSLDAGKNLVGPSLHGVIGRTSGTAPGFAYSDAMKAKALVWDDANLDKYLADPKGFIPGNKMLFAGVKKDDARADLIAYLNEATK